RIAEAIHTFLTGITMKRAITLPVLIGFMLSLLTNWAEDSKKPAAEQDPARARYQEINKRRSDLDRQINKLRYTLMRSDAANAEQEAVAAASKAYMDAGNADAGVMAAKKATAQVEEELKALLAKKFQENAEAKEILATQEKYASRNLELRYQIDLANFKLTNRYSPVSLKVEQDPELSKARNDVYNIKDRDERNKAQTAYYEIRKQKVAAIPESLALHKEIATAEAELKEISDGWKGRDDKLREVHRSIEKSEDAELAAGRKKVSDSRTAEQAAWNTEALNAFKAKYVEAQTALYAKAGKLLEQDADGKALLASLETSKKEYEELRNQKKAQKPVEK
ncbi:MAG: hypothetical protein O2857_07280, partial [Planctomycetota bacterium]|nr:hypothetical protein [Planctomycetota bacterium]